MKIAAANAITPNTTGGIAANEKEVIAIKIKYTASKIKPILFVNRIIKPPLNNSVI